MDITSLLGCCGVVNCYNFPAVYHPKHEEVVQKELDYKIIKHSTYKYKTVFATLAKTDVRSPLSSAYDQFGFETLLFRNGFKLIEEMHNNAQRSDAAKVRIYMRTQNKS